MNKLLISSFLFLCLLIWFPISADADLLTDEFMDEHLKTLEIQAPLVNDNYNYESFDKVPIRLKITNKITTNKNGVYDNMPLTFNVKQNVKYKGKVILKEGTRVNAKIAAYMERGMNGIPGAIIIDGFDIEGIESRKLKGTYIKKGLNLSLIVFPIKWALTPFPGVGSLTNFILGGNANISKRDTVIIYYYPEW